mgnify:CR=1 FL=1
MLLKAFCIIYTMIRFLSAVRQADRALAGQNAEIMRFVRPARFSPDKLLRLLGKEPEAPALRHGTY